MQGSTKRDYRVDREKLLTNGSTTLVDFKNINRSNQSFVPSSGRLSPHFPVTQFQPKHISPNISSEEESVADEMEEDPSDEIIFTPEEISSFERNVPKMLTAKVSLNETSTRSSLNNTKKVKKVEDLPFTYNLSWMQSKYSPMSKFYYKRQRSVTPKRQSIDKLYYRDVSQRERKLLKLEAIKEVKKDVEFKENCTFHPNHSRHSSRSIQQFIND